MATKRSTKPFSRNPKNKARVLATKSSLLKANRTFFSKPKSQDKPVITKVKKARPAVKKPVAVAAAVQLVKINPAPITAATPIVEQANKLAIITQLAKINEALKNFKLAERVKCDQHIQEAESKASAARAAVYLKAKKTGKFPAAWTYPSQF